MLNLEPKVSLKSKKVDICVSQLSYTFLPELIDYLVRYSSSEEVTSVEVDVVLEHIVDKVVAVIVVFVVVDGPVVSISIKGPDQVWPI